MATTNTFRDNTVVVDFASCVPRPSIREIDTILKNQMKLDIDNVYCVQMHHTRNCVLIMFSELHMAESFAARNDHQHWIRSNSSNYQIPVYVEDDAIDVRVHDLPLEIDSKVIENKLREYGEVLSMKFDRWNNFFPGLWNGVRIFRMRLEKAIPSYLRFTWGSFSEKSLISYQGQQATCQWCGMFAHQGQPCNQQTKIVNTEQPTTNTKTTSVSTVKTQIPPAKKSTTETKSLPQQKRNETTKKSTDEQPTANAKTTSAPVPPRRHQTAVPSTEKPTTEAESLPQHPGTESPQLNEFTTVERKKPKNQNRRNPPENENEDSMDPQPEGNDVPLDFSSPPRKKTTRDNK